MSRRLPGRVRTIDDSSDVGLRVLKDMHAIVVSRAGNSLWLKQDFQNVCKNIRFSGVA